MDSGNSHVAWLRGARGFAETTTAVRARRAAEKCIVGEDEVEVLDMGSSIAAGSWMPVVRLNSRRSPGEDDHL